MGIGLGFFWVFRPKPKTPVLGQERKIVWVFVFIFFNLWVLVSTFWVWVGSKISGLGDPAQCRPLITIILFFFGRWGFGILKKSRSKTTSCYRYRDQNDVRAGKIELINDALDIIRRIRDRRDGGKKHKKFTN